MGVRQSWYFQPPVASRPACLRLIPHPLVASRPDCLRLIRHPHLISTLTFAAQPFLIPTLLRNVRSRLAVIPLLCLRTRIIPRQVQLLSDTRVCPRVLLGTNPSHHFPYFLALLCSFLRAFHFPVCSCLSAFPPTATHSKNCSKSLLLSLCWSIEKKKEHSTPFLIKVYFPLSVF